MSTKSPSSSVACCCGYLAQGKEPRPWVSVELKPQGGGETPELIIANAKRVWRQAWAKA